MPAAPATASAAPPPDFLPLDRLQRQFESYLTEKRAEIEEARDARRYYHHAQWTAEQVDVLRRRGQPVVTFPRVGRKVDGIVGITEQQRQDPKAYPQNPGDGDGADLATAVLRYIADRNEWTSKKPECFCQGMVDGIYGVELRLVRGDEGDPDIEAEQLFTEDFFYDPRSRKPGFTDARFMGLSKFLDLDEALELFPDKEEQLRAFSGRGEEYAIPSDRDGKLGWYNADDRTLRLVEHWYKVRGGWAWAFYVGSEILAEGASPYPDGRGGNICRFIMSSTWVDQDGDRYGLVRAMRGMQDEVNQRRSKALAQSNQRSVTMEEGAVKDVEVFRREAARPDGVKVINPGFIERIKVDDSQADLAAQLNLMKDARDEMEAYANINPASLSGGSVNLSGRAVNLLQKPGLAEIWKPVTHYRNWNIRVYRAWWNMAQAFWTSRRWIRVTDSQKVAQFFQINQEVTDPYGLPSIRNAIGSLDVDVKVDEGPDTQTMMQDTADVLMQLLPTLPPGSIPMDVLVELLPISGETKDKWQAHIQKSQQPDPLQVQAAQTALHQAAAKVDETTATTALRHAQALSALGSAAHKTQEAHIDGARVFAGGLQQIAGTPQQAATMPQPQQPAAPDPGPAAAPPAAASAPPVTPGASPAVNAVLQNPGLLHHLLAARRVA